MTDDKTRPEVGSVTDDAAHTRLAQHHRRRALADACLIRGEHGTGRLLLIHEGRPVMRRELYQHVQGLLPSHQVRERPDDRPDHESGD